MDRMDRLDRMDRMDRLDRMDRMDRMERRYSEARIPDLQPPSRVQAIKASIYKYADWAFPDSVEIYAFGSSVNGFGDDSSDVDLVVSIPEEELRRIWKKTPRRDLARFALSDLSELFRDKAQGHIEVLEEVLGAKVPILKLNVDGVECDLSCNNLLPVFNSQLLRLYADKDPRVVQLAQEVKSWARKEGVHGAFMGQLSSYSFVLLTIFYMQNRGALPCLQKAAIGEPCELYYYERNKEFNVWMNFDAEPAPGDMAGKAVGTLSDFASFMTREKGFVWGEHVVSVREGCIRSLDDFPQLSIRHVSDDVTLHIEDPFEISRNLTCVFGHNANRNLWWALDRLARAASPGELRSFSSETDETSPVERQQTPDDIDEHTRVFVQPSTYTPDIQETAEATSSNFPPVQSRTAAEEWLEQGKRLKEAEERAAESSRKDERNSAAYGQKALLAFWTGTGV